MPRCGGHLQSTVPRPTWRRHGRQIRGTGCSRDGTIDSRAAGVGCVDAGVLFVEGGAKYEQNFDAGPALHLSPQAW
jgi:hypothetical protein